MKANSIKHDSKYQMNDLDKNMSRLPSKDSYEISQVFNVGPVGKVSHELDLRSGKGLKSVGEVEGG